MKLIIYTPEQILEEKEKLLKEASELIRKQGRSCVRYAGHLDKIRRKLRQLNEH